MVTLHLNAIINDLIDNPTKTASTRVASTNKILFKSATNANDFELYTHLEDPSINKSIINSSVTSKVDKLSSNNLGTGVKYRIYIKNRTTGEWKTKEMTSGSTSGTDTINLYNVYNYDWYAYSNNTNLYTDIPDIRSGNTLLIESANKDLIWDSGEILASNLTSNKRLEINFEHKLARIECKFDYRGLWTKSIAQHDIKILTTIKKGVFDITTGNFISHSDYTPTSLFTEAVLDSAIIQKPVHYFYTSETQNFPSIAIKYENLSYESEEDRTVTYNSSDNVEITLNGIAGIQATVGGRSVLNYLFIETPIIPIGTTTKWARGNLFYDTSLPGHSSTNYRYAFRRQSSETTPRLHKNPVEDFFMKNHQMPNSFINRPPGDRNDQTKYPTGDPCSRARPYNAWRMPTNAEIIEIQDMSSSNVTAIGTQLVSINPASSIISQYDSPKLIFERNGVMYNTNPNVTASAVPSISTNNNDGVYWSSFNATGGSGTGSFLRLYNNSDNLFKYERTGQGNVTALNVRCVRTTNYQ